MLHAFGLVLTYDLLEDRRIADIIIKKGKKERLVLYYAKEIDSTLPCIWSDRSQKTSKCGKTGAHDWERTTALYSCRGVFTNRFIFRLNFP